MNKYNCNIFSGKDKSSSFLNDLNYKNRYRTSIHSWHAIVFS